MECPACRTLNAAMSVKCIECGTTLISEAEPRSRAYVLGERRLNTGKYAWIGTIVGFGIGWLLINESLVPWNVSDRAIEYACAIVGGVAGKLLAWKRSRDLFPTVSR